MSTCISKEVSCPRCGATARAPLWTGVSAAANPELRRMILEESLFDWTCPACGGKTRLLYPMLYHDRPKGLMVYLAPAGGGEDLDAVAGQFPGLRAVCKRRVETPAELKEKILIFEAGLEDTAVELVKLALRETLEKKYHCRMRESYFMAASQRLRYLGCAFFPEGVEGPVRRGTSLDAYWRALEILQDLGYQDGPGFDTVDARLAAQLLEEYQSAG